MACLDSSSIARLVNDELVGAARDRAWQHGETCSLCAEAIRDAFVAADPQTMASTGLATESDVVRGAIVRGARVGRYVILRHIGTGGLSDVFSAFDPELERKVAVKVIKASALANMGPVLQLRLIREARSMARLSHPNVVAVHDVGTDHGQMFMALELVEGQTLRSWVRNEAPDWRAIRDVLLAAGTGLVAAHDAGLVHRDFKPGNVLVSAARHVKVLDFGLVRMLSGDAEPDSEIGFDLEVQSMASGGVTDDEPITGHGQLAGTPGYMAPEQYDEQGTIDHRADQFAFCVTLYEAVYGHRPFRGADVWAIRDATLAGKIEAERTDVSVPKWLRGLILRGLAVDPQDRFDSMRELLVALQTDRRSRRRQWVALGAAVSLSAIVSSGAALAWRGDTSRQIDDHVGDLVHAARAAAAKSYFVYPPADDPNRQTAYAVVLALEAEDGAARSVAQQRAEELRAEFSETLTRLGDRYWDQNGGRPFSADYYASALVFDAGNAHARERSLLTTGELATLRQQATTRSFTPGELEAAETLAALAEIDDARRIDRLATLYRRRGYGAGVSTSRHLETLLGPKAALVMSTATEPLAGRDERAVQASAKGTPSSESAAVVRQSSATRGSAVRSSKSVRRADRLRANRKAQAGRKHFRSNRLGEAEAAFHQALELDPGNVEALHGLAELTFERGRYRDAVKYASLAINRAPKRAQLHLLHGDARFKVLEYRAARAAYERARDLGHPQADGRLERLRGRLGG